LFFSLFQCFLPLFCFVLLLRATQIFCLISSLTNIFLLSLTFIYFSSRSHSRPVASSHTDDRPVLYYHVLRSLYHLVSTAKIFLASCLPPFFYMTISIIYIILYFYSYYKFLFSSTRLHFLFICHSCTRHKRSFSLHAAHTSYGSQQKD
jgi:hypothetical protein